MKKKQIIGLAVALAVLVVVYGALSLSNRRVEEEEQAREESQVIQVADLGEIASFSFEAPAQEPLHFEKKDGVWICTEDEELELEQTYPEGIVDTFASLTATRRMDEIDALADYGLEEPSYVISLQPADGKVKKELTLLIGNSTGDEYYLQIEGQEDVVYTVASSAVGNLDHSLADMEKAEDDEETETIDE